MKLKTGAGLCGMGAFHGKVQWPEHEGLLLWRGLLAGCYYLHDMTLRKDSGGFLLNSKFCCWPPKYKTSFVHLQETPRPTTKLCQKVWRCKTILWAVSGQMDGWWLWFRPTEKKEQRRSFEWIQLTMKGINFLESTHIIYHRKLPRFFSFPFQSPSDVGKTTTFIQYS